MHFRPARASTNAGQVINNARFAPFYLFRDRARSAVGMAADPDPYGLVEMLFMLYLSGRGLRTLPDCCGPRAAGQISNSSQWFPVVGVAVALQKAALRPPGGELGY